MWREETHFCGVTAPTCFLKPDNDLEIWKHSDRRSGVTTSDALSLFFYFFGAVDMTHHAKTRSTKKRKGAVLSTVTLAAYEASTCLSAVARAHPWSSEGYPLSSSVPDVTGQTMGLSHSRLLSCWSYQDVACEARGLVAGASLQLPACLIHRSASQAG